MEIDGRRQKLWLINSDHECVWEQSNICFVGMESFSTLAADPVSNNELKLNHLHSPNKMKQYSVKKFIFNFSSFRTTKFLHVLNILY